VECCRDFPLGAKTVSADSPWPAGDHGVQEDHRKTGPAALLASFSHRRSGQVAGRPTARNLLCYACEADFVEVRVPTSASRTLKIEALCHVTGTGKDEMRARMPAFFDPLPVPEARRSKTKIEMFEHGVHELRLWPVWNENENEYPKQHTDKLGHKPDQRFLSSFVSRQRIKYKKGDLDEEEAKVLRTLPPWSFTPHTETWKAMYDSARDLLQRQQTSVPESSQTFRYPRKSSSTHTIVKLGSG
jgi:hypothetical protein